MGQKVFPFVPAHTDWQAFNGNLIMYYGNQPIPITDETNWQDTAKNISQTPFFTAYNIPDPDQFQTWQDWANQFVILINGQPRA